jgi:hypothetical protein
MSMVAGKRKDIMTRDRLGRITESRTEDTWGRPAQPVKNLGWFESKDYSPACVYGGLSTDREWYAYHATGLVIRGDCASELIAEALSDEGLNPVTTVDGRAMASIWFNVIHDSVCGRYHEILLSLDSTGPESNAAVSFSSDDHPFHYLYNNLDDSICQQQFFHSLYISSPLSIAWGREMQAFPKHPKVADTRIEETAHTFEADICWGHDRILQVKAHKPQGVGAMLRQGLGLLSTIRLDRLVKFLFDLEVKIPIQMPKATAVRYQCPTNYRGYVRKGLNPMAIRCWPWQAEDSLQMGEIQVGTGCESNNGHRLLRDAGFTPRLVTYVPYMQAYVGRSLTF